MRADLHVHTFYSDGLLSPEEAVIKAKHNGVKILSVTDHDTAAGNSVIRTLSKKHGLISVDGIEISAYSGDIKVHTLAYNADKNNPDFKAFLKELYDGSFLRAEDIIYKLNKCGVNLSMQEVLLQRTKEDTPIHGMHIARAGAKKGYANSPFAFYQKYMLIGCPAHSSVARPSPEKTVEIISAAGGFSSLAHPGRIEMNARDLKSLIISIKRHGLGGIEAVYSTHTDTETAYYKELAKELDLLVTGGSDTHYPGGNREIGKPPFCPDDALLHKLEIC